LETSVNFVVCFLQCDKARQRSYVDLVRHKIDGETLPRALRRGTVDYGSTADRLPISRQPAPRRWSLFTGVPTSRDDDESRAPAPSDSFSLCHQLTSSRRPVTREHSSSSNQTSSPARVSDSSKPSTDAPLQLHLQAKVKVSERPVRCLVSARSVQCIIAIACMF